MVGGSEQDVFGEQSCAALFGEPTDTGIAGGDERHVDAFVREPREQCHALALTFRQHPLVIVQIGLLPDLARRPEGRSVRFL